MNTTLARTILMLVATLGTSFANAETCSDLRKVYQASMTDFEAWKGQFDTQLEYYTSKFQIGSNGGCYIETSEYSAEFTCNWGVADPITMKKIYKQTADELLSCPPIKSKAAKIDVRTLPGKTTATLVRAPSEATYLEYKDASVTVSVAWDQVTNIKRGTTRYNVSFSFSRDKEND